MTKLPVLVIVGRPNVGKSSLFNRFIGARRSIVHPQSGVTRDRVELIWKWNQYALRLVDTGGAAFDNHVPYAEKVFEQIHKAVDLADIVLFVVDAKTGLTPFDRELANWLRKFNKKVLLVVNKTDLVEAKELEFSKLGFDEVYSVSAMHELGIQDLILDIEKIIQPVSVSLQKAIRIAIVGKPNVGKSTTINQLIKEPRLIVDDKPGTTRDAVDVPFNWKKRDFVLVDTAGLRKRKKVNEPVEFYSVQRTKVSIRHADVVLLMIDAMEGPTLQDLKILQQILDEGRGCLIAFNKWDLSKELKNQKKEFLDLISERWPHFQIIPKLAVSALTSDGLSEIMENLIHIYQNAGRRISTPDLNRVLEKALKKYHPPAQQGRRLKIYYMTQVGVYPPEFILFVNNKKLVSQNYLAYLEHRIREHLDFKGVPFRFGLRKHSE